MPEPATSSTAVPSPTAPTGSPAGAMPAVARSGLPQIIVTPPVPAAAAQEPGSLPQAAVDRAPSPRAVSLQGSGDGPMDATTSFCISSSEPADEVAVAVAEAAVASAATPAPWQRHVQPMSAFYSDAVTQTTAEERHKTAGAMRESSAQTWICWQKDKDVFQCTRCSKPPLPSPPLPPGRAPRRSRRRRRNFGPASRGTPGASDSDSEGSQASQASKTSEGLPAFPVLRYPELQRTPWKSQALMIFSCLLSWNVDLPSDSCCVVHGLLAELCKAAKRLQVAPCTEEPFSTVHQCSECHAISDASSTCQWCLFQGPDTEDTSTPLRSSMSL
uniref:Uncharacterized protein n=1 Tax=Alexandrium catenella TaxID=2925 RepID=A0A7S1LS19_ALECA|mmetsp:Transcript_12614/g.34636  ORF Transcript_12614/g.34636 Transcript_12614/m.34636 type:complete len:330 (+) Transcript_12614:69-1058(+)